MNVKVAVLPSALGSRDRKSLPNEDARPAAAAALSFVVLAPYQSASVFIESTANFLDSPAFLSASV